VLQIQLEGISEHHLFIATYYYSPITTVCTNEALSVRKTVIPIHCALKSDHFVLKMTQQY